MAAFAVGTWLGRPCGGLRRQSGTGGRLLNNPWLLGGASAGDRKSVAAEEWVRLLLLIVRDRERSWRAASPNSRSANKRLEINKTGQLVKGRDLVQHKLRSFCSPSIGLQVALCGCQGNRNNLFCHNHPVNTSGYLFLGSG